MHSLMKLLDSRTITYILKVYSYIHLNVDRQTSRWMYSVMKDRNIRVDWPAHFWRNQYVRADGPTLWLAVMCHMTSVSPPIPGAGERPTLTAPVPLSQGDWFNEALDTRKFARSSLVWYLHCCNQEGLRGEKKELNQKERPTITTVRYLQKRKTDIDEKLNNMFSSR